MKLPAGAEAEVLLHRTRAALAVLKNQHRCCPVVDLWRYPVRIEGLKHAVAFLLRISAPGWLSNMLLLEWLT